MIDMWPVSAIEGAVCAVCDAAHLQTPPFRLAVLCLLGDVGALLLRVHDLLLGG